MRGDEMRQELCPLGKLQPRRTWHVHVQARTRTLMSASSLAFSLGSLKGRCRRRHHRPRRHDLLQLHRLSRAAA